MGSKGFIYKVVFCIVLSVLIIASIIYYSYCYIINNNLIFTESDRFILLLFGVGTLVVCIVLIIVLCLLVRIRNNLKEIVDTMVDIEDNNAKLHRETEEIIMKLAKDLGVMNHPKKN